jgi:hypothetical protein
MTAVRSALVRQPTWPSMELTEGQLEFLDNYKVTRAGH